jgi:hypothetical protein
VANLMRSRKTGPSESIVAGGVAALPRMFALGALAHRFVLDCQNARRRRHTWRARTARRRCAAGARETAKRARYLEGIAEGMAHKAMHAVPGTKSTASRSTTCRWHRRSKARRSAKRSSALIRRACDR